MIIKNHAGPASPASSASPANPASPAGPTNPASPDSPASPACPANLADSASPVSPAILPILPILRVDRGAGGRGKALRYIHTDAYTDATIPTYLEFELKLPNHMYTVCNIWDPAPGLRILDAGSWKHAPTLLDPNGLLELRMSSMTTYVIPTGSGCGY